LKKNVINLSTKR